jgi:DNA-binding transcriptional regulator YdaS (Cro superfamily)
MQLTEQQPDVPAVLSETMSKAEFAECIGVSPARVSQYITAGKISGDALVGSGRAARIRFEIAVAQLRERLDPSQMAGNGRNTRLGETPVVISSAAAARLEAAIAARFDRARDDVLRLLRANFATREGS